MNLHIILQKPPAGIHFGLQKGHGNNFEIVDIQVSGMVDLHFILPIDIRGDKQKVDSPQFGGPFVQGPPAEKFIYVSIGTMAGQLNSPWTRRLKIPLRNITWEMIDKAMANSGLETIVPGTAKDGSPTCATVKPFTGWEAK
jgi:hypothetical protein